MACLLQLCCWVRGDDLASVFLIKIAETDHVDDLRNRIKEENKVTFQNMDARHLVIRKVCVPLKESLKESLQSLGLQLPEPLRPWTRLSKVFTDIPTEDHLHVVVDPPSLADKQYDEFRERQTGPARAILCGRPSSAVSAMPMELLHPAFGQFVDDCKTFKNTTEDNTLVRKLQSVLTSFTRDDDLRAQRIREMFEEYGLSFETSTIEKTSLETDGDMTVNGHRFAIVELQNEVGSMKADPNIQAVYHYFESTRKQAVEIALLSPAVFSH
ncbi:hypothetical protein BJ138DRAFT_1103865 [Hygrophoropsis aurantiaca]|uniref:Uncharacterized protein n=1 Tax=Hygrophoropsis aurantiaca TaxID=72124 RepID=A0ACB8A5P8_9AGAM|nr:hypothetical protein BJ138DRAFT_1103865 [Hygrophoropsis aurantiaca]